MNFRKAQSLLADDYCRHLKAAIKKARQKVEKVVTVKGQGGAYVTYTVPR